MTYAHKVDVNQKEIVDGLRRAGAVVRCMPPDVGFDLLVAYRGMYYVIEVKAPGHLNELTENEKKRREEFASVGCHYIVADSLEAVMSALKMLW